MQILYRKTLTIIQISTVYNTYILNHHTGFLWFLGFGLQIDLLPNTLIYASIIFSFISQLTMVTVIGLLRLTVFSPFALASLCLFWRS